MKKIWYYTDLGTNTHYFASIEKFSNADEFASKVSILLNRQISGTNVQTAPKDIIDTWGKNATRVA